MVDVNGVWKVAFSEILMKTIISAAESFNGPECFDHLVNRTRRMVLLRLALCFWRFSEILAIALYDIIQPISQHLMRIGILK